MTDVTLAYRPTGSAVHRLHPFVMLSWLVAILVVALVVEHPFWLVAVLLTTVPVARAAWVLAQWKAVMRFMLWMAVAIVVINVLVSNQGSHVLLEAGFQLPLLGTPRLTVEALAFGGSMAVRLAAIISAFTLVNLCVHPDDLMRAAIKLRLPYRSVLVTSLSIRFVPVLMQDARTIADVQQSRGLSFDSGGIVQRIRNRGALILPLLSNSLDRAVQVAEAMESRAYGASVRRTFYRDLPPVGRDVALTVVLLAGIVLLLASRVAGLGGYEYYPSLGDLSMTSSEWVALGMLCAILLSVTIPSSPRGEECR
jgi:energy-coupling factor transport system permease protein